MMLINSVFYSQLRNLYRPVSCTANYVNCHCALCEIQRRFVKFVCSPVSIVFDFYPRTHVKMLALGDFEVTIKFLEIDFSITIKRPFTI